MRHRAMGTLLAVLLPTTAVAAGTPPAEPPRPKVSDKVLAAVEKELTRLDKQAGQEPGPDWPEPSSQVAFLLLAGLAAQGDLIPQPSPQERRDFGLDQGRTRAQLVAVAEDARLVKEQSWRQDKSGSYRILVWKLYRRQGEKWIERGRGKTVAGD